MATTQHDTAFETDHLTMHDRLHMPRSRGAASGLLIVILGVWGGLIPFVGPSFDYAFTPDQSWHWTTGRLLLEVLPAVADDPRRARDDGQRQPDQRVRRCAGSPPPAARGSSSASGSACCGTTA